MNTKKLNAIILKIVSVQCALLSNANAMDDDLAFSWENLQDEWKDLKDVMDKYINNVNKQSEN